MQFPFHQKRLRIRAFGTLLLALPLSGIALQLSPAQAQPAAPLPTKKPVQPLSPEQKSAITKAMSIAQASGWGKNVVDLSVQNASLDDLIAQIKMMLPDQPVSVEVRGAQPVKVSFDLKNARVGTVLSNVAALAGCRLWVTDGGLLITPKAQLTQAELAAMKAQQAGEWSLDVANRDRGGGDSDGTIQGGGSGWTSDGVRDRLLAQAIGKEVTGGTDPAALPAVNAKMLFGDFSPESQTMLQRLADSATGTRPNGHVIAPFRLTESTPVTIDTSKPGWINIRIDHNTSDPRSTVGVLGIRIN